MRIKGVHEIVCCCKAAIATALHDDDEPPLSSLSYALTASNTMVAVSDPP